MSVDEVAKCKNNPKDPFETIHWSCSDGTTRSQKFQYNKLGN
jgi:hypothetical protein